MTNSYLSPPFDHDDKVNFMGGIYDAVGVGFEIVSLAKKGGWSGFIKLFRKLKSLFNWI